MTFQEPMDVLKPDTGPSRKHLVETELECLTHQHVQVMAENDEYVVIRAMADQIPNILYEIGALREEVLKESGETSGRDVDLDYFDLYYLHMVIWSKKEREVAGACRVGQTDIIIKRFGHRGLFTGTMFHYSPLFLEQTGPSLEIGRFNIRKRHRGLLSPASLLLKGIGRFISYNPRYRAIIGPVTVANSYGLLSQQLILSFLKKNTYDARPARHVEPIAAAETGRTGRTAIVKTQLKEMGPLSRFVSRLEEDGKGVPRDIRHYVKLGGKLIGVSPGGPAKKVLTGLMLLDLVKCRPGILKHFMGGPGVDGYFDYHGGRESRAA